MDAIDARILHILDTDSALTSESLGARIGLSPSATHRRVRLLEERGLIAGYRAKLSAEALGNPSTVFVSVTLIDQRRSTLAAFEEALLRTEIIKEAHLMSGESDYLLKVLVRNDDSYERLHREILSALPGVQRLVTQFTIRTVISSA
jgi:DNA-binding Lrp family transcriptional regulator